MQQPFILFKKYHWLQSVAFVDPYYFFDCDIFLYLIINCNFLKVKKLICKKIKTPPIPVSDVLPLFWFFMVQYISISRLIIVFIFYLVNDIINCLYYFSLHLKSKEVKMLKKVILWFTIVVFFLMLLSKNINLTFIFNF